jgi:molybdopterin-guanine dinucleotide biosynthesis protein B
MSKPLLGFCAHGSGAGKTTLLTNLIPMLVEAGLRISVIKHTHHDFDIDQPGKDSYRLRESGAGQVLLGSRARWALMTTGISRKEGKVLEPGLQELLPHIDASLADLIVIEGFKQAPIPKIEVYRPTLGKPLLAERDEYIIAVATDGMVETALPLLDLNDTTKISEFVQRWLKDAHE